jgi:hypothetical protein
MRPSPIIIKLCNRKLRLTILKNKRLSIPAPTDVERGNGIKKFIVVEDLTVPTFKKLSDLLADDRVDKAWSTEGRLRCVLMGDDKGVKKVKSVFDTTDDILLKSTFWIHTNEVHGIAVKYVLLPLVKILIIIHVLI